MTQQSLKGTDSLMVRTLLSLRSLKQCRLSRHLYVIMLFAMSGCSSLHVNVSPAVNWDQVEVIKFQSPHQDPWNLTQAIRAELTDLGFQIDDSGADPDLLFSYSTQNSPDITDEGEVITRLNSLHIQFMDPATEMPVTAVDYFYPAVTNPPAPVTGVKEVFSGLQQRILTGKNPPAMVTGQQPNPKVSATPVEITSPAQDQEPPSEPFKPSPIPNSIQVEDNVAGSRTQSSKPAVINRETKPTALKKMEDKTLKPVERTRSPWVPKLKSWGFENWGQDSSDEF